MYAFKWLANLDWRRFMGDTKNISYFRENIYKYRDRIDGTCLVAFHYLLFNRQNRKRYDIKW